jgi:hypothetical protein
MADADVPGALADRGQKHFRGGRMGVFFQEVMFGGPNVVVSALIGKHSLLESILEKRMLGIANPGPWELMFVEAAEFHAGKYL